ncbi:MAG: 30S ribosomal protein S6 [Oscillospiraceae bacterium]|nr:30S ribosomal protein S6 [Oscillospiraceae bacterium]
MSAAYETIMVLNTKLDEEATKALIEKFTSLIAENGAVESVDEWGKRRLAYEIMDETEGYYVLVNFTSDTAFPKELDRVYKITDGVLRSIIVRKDA